MFNLRRFGNRIVKDFSEMHIEAVKAPRHPAYRNIADAEWNDWRWQMSAGIRDIDKLTNCISVSAQEKEGMRRAGEAYRWSLTPYFLGLIDPFDPTCPIRLQVLPDERELFDPDGLEDPLLEEKHSPVEDMIHLYPNRVALCVSDSCAAYCRHCFRKRRTLRKPRPDSFDRALEYIKGHSEICDVLVTGGDPLMLSDEILHDRLSRLREIKHVKILRIGSRLPATLPMRITPELAGMLAEFHPLYLNTQFNHPREITAEAAGACDILSRAGIQLGNQSVLLKGVNDRRETLMELFQKLLLIRVKPYYIFHPHRQRGTRHFRLSIDRGLELMDSLRGYLPGMAIPTYAVDTPHGKVPILKDRIVSNDDNGTRLRTFDGEIWFEKKED